MKARILNSLKSRVLLLDGKIFDHEVFKHGIHLSDEDHKTDFIDGNWNLLGKLKDLTDKDCEGLVESWESIAKDGTMVYENYKDSIPKKRNAKESFLSALEAEGLHLNGNPNGKKPHLGMFIEQKSNCVQDCDKAIKKWQEAEQNVFSPETLIFVEQ